MSANTHQDMTWWLSKGSPEMCVYNVIQAVNAKSLTGDAAGATSPLQAPAMSTPGVSGSTSDAPAAGTANKSGATANKPVFKSKKRQVKCSSNWFQPGQTLTSHVCHQQS